MCHFHLGTPTKRPVIERPVIKRSDTGRPDTKGPDYEMYRLPNVELQNSHTSNYYKASSFQSLKTSVLGLVSRKLGL